MTVATPAATTPATPDASATPPAAQGQMPTPQTPADPARTELKDLPESWQNEIKALRGENQTYRKAEQERATAKTKEDEEKLKATQEWEKLASQREARIKALEPLEADNLELTELLTKYIDGETKNWPAEVKDTAPKGEVSAKEMAAWANSHRALAEKLMSSAAPQKPPVKPGNSNGPTPTVPGNNPVGASSNGEPLVNVKNRL